MVKVPIAWGLADVMSKKRTTIDRAPGRYEYRVWGEHRKARKLLARLADDRSDETFEDCYLLGEDATWNAKVRDNTLKLKQLVAERKGFEQWQSSRFRCADDTPAPFDTLFEDLRLDRPQRGKSYDLERAVAALDPDAGVRPVFVTKHRRRYTIGDMRAEVTDIEVHDTSEVLRTLSIEGDDLDDLVKLRKSLGLRDEPNVAVHQAIDIDA